MPRPLIDAAELANALAGAEPPAILDVRWRLAGPAAIDDYRRGHIPGAHFVDLDADLSGPPGPGRHPLPDPAAFEAAMGRLGVDGERPVVAYDDADSTSAARAWWLLSYFGHDHVYVLDGGLRAWVEAGHALSTIPPASADGTFRARPGHLALIDAAGAVELARRGLLLDARAVERYRGEIEPVDRVAGHIPGARSAPTMANVTSNGRFHDPSALRRRFEQLGYEPGTSIGAYCGSGVTAAHEVLALTLAGIPAALYIGSWSDWITDPTRPVATGEEP